MHHILEVVVRWFAMLFVFGIAGAGILLNVLDAIRWIAG